MQRKLESLHGAGVSGVRRTLGATGPLTRPLQTLAGVWDVMPALEGHRGADGAVTVSSSQSSCS